MENTRSTGRRGNASGLTWWVASGFTIGIAGLLGLVAVASATPLDPDSARTAGFSMGLFGVDVGLRSAGVMIFVLGAGALFAQSARHSSLLEAREQQNSSRPRE